MGSNPWGVSLATARSKGLPVLPPGRAQLRGGLLIPSDGWYRFRDLPQEADMVLRIDGGVVDWDHPQPMLVGVHAVGLEFPTGRMSEPPPEIEVLGGTVGGSRILQIADLTHPSVAAIPGIQAPPVAVVDGYPACRRVAAVAGRPRDLGVDGAGRLFVLSWDRGGYTVSRVTADGVLETEWRPPIGDYDRACMAVGGDGRVVVVGRREMLFYTPDGQLQHTSPLDFGDPALDAAFMSDGRILLSVNERDSLDVFDAMGRHLDSLRDLDAETPAIARPMGIAIGPDGGLLVVEGNGRALLFQTADGAWPPRLESVFDTGMRSSVDSRGCAFDGRQRLVIPDRNRNTVRVYDRTGRRAMAGISTHDLSAQPLQHPVAFARNGTTMYAVDEGPGCLMALDAGDLRPPP